MIEPSSPVEVRAPGPSAAAALRSLFEEADSGLALLDCELQLVRTNPVLTRTAGPEAAGAGGPAAGLLPALPVTAIEALRGVLAGGDAVRGLVLTETGGPSERRTFVCGCFPVHEDGVIAGLWWTLREITADRRDRAARERLNRELHRELEDEHRVVEQLGTSLLPDRLPSVPGADLASSFTPAGDRNVVGGDFYDVFRVGKPHCWMVVIGDVCGKGAEAASLTALARYTLRAAAIREGAEPAKLLAELNEAIRRQRNDDRFVTAVCAFLESGRQGALRLTVSVAGHPPPLVLRAGGVVERIRTKGALLGVWDDAGLTETETQLSGDDRMVLYTDGVLEAHAPDGPFEEGLERAVSELAPQDAASTVTALRDALGLAGGDDPRDDIAILIVRPAAVP
jgi:serine phosphatase RsbU (regulator of sigma subunit)